MENKIISSPLHQQKDKTTKVVKHKKNNSKNSSSSSKNTNNKVANFTSSSENNTTNSTSVTSTNNGQRQLGLNDVAVWTDSTGVTHHVNSDGIDRQTISGSSQVNYNDWSGSLPSNAQIVKQ